MAKIFIETYGCSANMSESEMMAGILEKQGNEITDSIESSDIVIINTCIVKRPTEIRMIYRIKQLATSRKKLIVAGCMPEARMKDILKIAPDACMVSTHQISKIAEAVKALADGEKKYFVGKSAEENTCLPRKRGNSLIGIVEISKGCLGRCTYCSVKGAKGNLQSYSLQSIIQEIKNSVSEGCKEIWLTSQDCGCYGKDKGTSLTDLLHEIINIEGDFRVRLGMMNPEHVLLVIDDLIECMEGDSFYKFIHIPVQSGSDTVLQRMGRRYNSSDFREIIREFRNKIPQMNVRTDIIIGFPGESRQEFIETVELIEKTTPDIVNISKFGAMKGTPAAMMRQLEDSIMSKRTREISDICRRITLEGNRQQVGAVRKIFVSDRSKKGLLIGRDEYFRQVALQDSDSKIGEFVEREIKSASLFGLSVF